MSTPFLGEIILVSFDFPPQGYAFCEGQLLPINQNQALFSLLGTTYGGDGIQTFALPDLRGRAPINFGQGPGLSSYSLGQPAGQESVSLNLGQLAPHNHQVAASSSNGNAASPAGDLWARSRNRDGIYWLGGAGGTLPVDAIGQTGGGQPHENRSPYLAMRYCMAIQGIFPSRA